MKETLSDSAVAVRTPGNGPLALRISAIQEMLDNPRPSREISELSLKALKIEMKGMVEKKIVELETLVANIAAVEGFYGLAPLSESVSRGRFRVLSSTLFYRQTYVIYSIKNGYFMKLSVWTKLFLHPNSNCG